MKKAEIQVNNANKQAFIAASKPVYEAYAKEVPVRQADHRRASALGDLPRACSSGCAGVRGLLEWVALLLMAALTLRGDAWALCSATLGHSLGWYDEVASWASPGSPITALRSRR